MTTRLMRKISLPFFLLLLAACAMPQGGMKGGGFRYSGTAPKYPPALSQYYIDEVIDVATEPPGARVLVNESAVGYAPVRYSVRRFWRGDPGRMLLDTVKIEAMPISAGQCVQSGIYGQNNLKIPSPVSFKMADCGKAFEYPEPAGAHLPSGSK